MSTIAAPAPAPTGAIAHNLLARFRAVRAATMAFVAPLSPEDLMVQSTPEASPVKWHLAHTSWFFETFVLRDFLTGYEAPNPDFLWLFNSYYKSLGEMPEKKLRASFSRPPLDEILAYRQTVDRGVERLLAQGTGEDALRRIALGLEHEQQHLELIATDIKHAFFTNPLHPAYSPQGLSSFGAVGRSASQAAPPVSWVPFTPGNAANPGVVEIGLTPDAADVEAFAFDNETPRHKVYLAPFRLASRLVTCAEYLAFLEADGYMRPELWLSEGWDTMRAEGWQSPLYWRRDKQGEWQIFTLRGFEPVAALASTPVTHLSFFEADAFARWSGHRLPTEFEWEHAANAIPNIPAGPSFAPFAKGGVGAPQANMLESGAFHPTTAIQAEGLQQMFGDAWEWTQSPYTGYPGYKPLPGALGEYNGKFMSSQIILRGGSCVTPQTHIRATYRNFFPPSTRWQFSGLRLARDGAA